MKYLLRLEEKLQAVLNHAISYEDASHFMMAEMSQIEIQRLLKKQTKTSMKPDDLEILKNLLNMALVIYTYSGLDTGMSDTDYDNLVSLYQTVTGDGTFTIDVKDENKEYHKYPILRGTLQKVYSLGEFDQHQKVNDHRETLDQWIKRTEEKIYNRSGKKVSLENEKVICFPKWDGVSCVFEFQDKHTLSRALTRGHTDVNTAKNITCHFPDITGEVDGPHGLKTEIMVWDATVPEYSIHAKRNYAQSRSVASAIVNKEEPTEFDSLLVIKKLRYLPEGGSGIEELCQEVYDDPYLRCRLSDREAILQFSEENRNVNGCRCDGVVIRLLNPELIQILGRENDKNNYEVAYKFTEVSTYSKVTGIEFRMGLFGRLTPVVTFEPVKMKGNTVKSASLGSMERFRSLGLSKGDTIKILYDIIPYVVVDSQCELSGNDVIKEPRYCPDCGSMLISDGGVVSCQNEKCSWVTKGKIINYIEKLKIPHISGMTVLKLYDAGFLTSIDELYTLKDHRKELIQLDGLGKDSVDLILRGIASVENKISEAVLIGAIGIEGASRKTFEKVMELYTLDELLEFAKDKRYDYLEQIDGIGEKKAKRILKGIQHNRELIQKLRGYLDLQPVPIFHPKFTVCFTKIRDQDKELFVHAHEGAVVENVTKSTSFLVVPDLSVTSTNVKKANKYGIPLVHIDDMESYIEANFG